MTLFNENETLWHYTDSIGLLGILQSKLFMASSAIYLNDAAELSYGKKCLAKMLYAIGGWLGNSHPDEPGSSIVDCAEALSGEKRGWVHPPDMPETYIVSFSEDGDVLSQWRGYTEGSGFSLGFNREELELHFRTSNSQTELGKVVYGEKSSQNLFKPIITEQFLRSSGLSKFDVTLSGIHYWDQFYDAPRLPQLEVENLLREVGWCKDPAFEEEKEWRLKSNGTYGVKVRTRRGELLPYAELSFPTSALREVRLGPGGDRELRAKAIKYALGQHGFSVRGSNEQITTGVRISYSEAPYRP